MGVAAPRGLQGWGWGCGHWGNPPLLAWVRMFSGDSPISQQGWGSRVSLSFPWGDGGGRGLWGSSWNCWDGFRSVWLRVCRDAGGTHPPSPQAPGEQDPLSPPPATVASRAATLPGAGAWGQAPAGSATSVSPPYLFTPFLTPLLVQVSLPVGGWDSQGLAPITAQLLGFFFKSW